MTRGNQKPRDWLRAQERDIGPSGIITHLHGLSLKTIHKRPGFLFIVEYRNVATANLAYSYRLNGSRERLASEPSGRAGTIPATA